MSEPPPQRKRGLSIEDVEAHQHVTRQSVKHLESNFAERVLELVPDIPTEYDDPLGIYSSSAANQQQAKPKVLPRRRGRRKVQENIFRDFGKEHDTSALHEIEVGGIVITRANFKRFWQCDRELGRWMQDLEDNKRNDKLLLEVRDRWHEDFRRDRAELMAKHTSFARQRADAQRPDSPPEDRDGVTPMRRASTCAQQLKDLQNKLKPKELQRRKGLKKFEFGGDPFFQAIWNEQYDADLGSRPRRSSLNEAEDALYHLLNFLMRHYSSLEEAFHMIDRNGNNILSMAEFATSLRDLGYPGDLKFLYRLLEKDRDGYISQAEFMNLKPYLQKGIDTQGVRVRDADLAKSSGRLSADTTQQADLDVSGDTGTDLQDSQRDVMRSEASVRGSPPESPGAARRRSSGISDTTDGDALSDVQEASPRSAAPPRPPPPGSRRPSAPPPPASAQARGPRLPQMPQTLTLLLFRNADKLHAGEAVFVKGWPLPCLRDLLTACGKACRPIVGPVEALLNPALQPVRSCEEMRSGGIYLLKGHEGLEPPPLFFSHQETQHLSASSSAPSLRKLTLAKDAVAADQEIRRAPSPVQLQMTSMSRGGSSWLMSQANTMPVAGSPPWPSQGLPRNPKSLSKWQADSKLGRVMMWGGLGQLPRHTEYHEWQPALRPRSNGKGGIDQTRALTM